MHTQVLIVLVGILFFATTMQGRRLPHQEKHQSKYNVDRQFREAAQSLHRQKARHFRQKLEHNRRDSNDEQQQFGEQMLEATNFYRSLVCSSPLTLNDELSAGAQKYAEHLAEIGSLEPSETEDVGETLYMKDISEEADKDYGLLAYEAGYQWFAEIQYYDFVNGGLSPETSYFTQLVWNSSQELGVGIGLNSDRTQVYVVARYSPPGNQEGQFEDNVALGDCY